MTTGTEITRKIPAPRIGLPSSQDILVLAFQAFLAQERAQILMWASEYLTVYGRRFDGSFGELRDLHAKSPDKLERVGNYLALEREVDILRAKLCP